jgi:hypothetical protein
MPQYYMLRNCPRDLQRIIAVPAKLLSRREEGGEQRGGNLSGSWLNSHDLISGR